MSYTKYSLIHDQLIKEIKYIKSMQKFEKLDSFYKSIVNGAKCNVNFIFKNRHNPNLYNLYRENYKAVSGV